MKKFAKLTALLLSLALVLSLAACGSKNQPAPESQAPAASQPAETPAAPEETPAGSEDPAELPTLTVSLHPAYITTPVAYAIFNDMAKDYGFNLEYQVYASGGPQNEALGSNLWDVGVIGGAFVTSVNTYDAHVIGNFINGAGCNAIFVRNDSPIAQATNSNPSYPDILGSAETVRGCKIITNLGTTGHVQVQKWLEALGLTEDDVELIQMDYASGYSAFISGEADVLATIGPFSTRAMIAYADEWSVAAGFDSLGLSQYEDIVCSADAYANKYDLLCSFVKMVMDANDILANDFELTVSTYQKWMSENGQEIDDEEARMECSLKPILSSAEIQELINTNFGEYERMVWEMNIESGTITADSLSKLETNVTSDVMEAALAK